MPVRSAVIIQIFVNQIAVECLTFDAILNLTRTLGQDWVRKQNLLAGEGSGRLRKHVLQNAVALNEIFIFLQAGSVSLTNWHSTVAVMC